MKIREMMKFPVISLKPSDSVSMVLEIMKNKNINGAPVVDEENHLMGIVVKADIYRFLIAPGHYDTCPIEWVMTKDVVIADVDEDAIEVAKRLRNNDILAIPVLENDIVAGIVTMEDFVDYYINTNDVVAAI